VDLDETAIMEVGAGIFAEEGLNAEYRLVSGCLEKNMCDVRYRYGMGRETAHPEIHRAMLESGLEADARILPVCTTSPSP